MDQAASMQSRCQAMKPERRKPGRPSKSIGELTPEKAKVPTPARKRAATAQYCKASTAQEPSAKGGKFRRLNLASDPSPPKPAHITKLECAVNALRPGLPPRGGLLPCRAAERKKISSHLRAGVQQGGTTQVLYISGMPGTGKTAIVLESLEHLRKECEFFLVHINAMKLGSPVQVFREIADQMSCKTNNSQACQHLNEMFETRRPQDPVVVLLIDEVDCLVTQSQAVLYKVFDWLGMPKARLVLAAISNTMDLPERLLPRVASRFHIERVNFEPYNKDQLYEILCSRLKGQGVLSAFGDIALRLCGAKIAANSGDIRKALQVCRRAAEIRLQMADADAVGAVVVLSDLQAAEQELILANPVSQAILDLSAVTRRFLSAVVIELKRKDTEMVLYRKAASKFNKIIAMTEMREERGNAVPNMDTSSLDMLDAVQTIVARLISIGVLREQASTSPADIDNGPWLSLGSLDVEDLTSTLLKLEDDALICELLEGGQLGEAARTSLQEKKTFTPIE